MRTHDLAEKGYSHAFPYRGDRFVRIPAPSGTLRTCHATKGNDPYDDRYRGERSVHSLRAEGSHPHTSTSAISPRGVFRTRADAEGSNTYVSHHRGERFVQEPTPRGLKRTPRCRGEENVRKSTIFRTFYSPRQPWTYVSVPSAAVDVRFTPLGSRDVRFSPLGGRGGHAAPTRKLRTFSR